MQTITYSTAEGEKIKGSFWKSSESTNKPTIIYVHGGGLIFGNRDDLPEDYIGLFLDAGYSLLALDYLLAPESSFRNIIGSLQAGVSYFLNHFNELGLPNNRYILFGRSAGAYLCLQLLAENLSQSPEAFIDFYGFESLLTSSMLKPNALYLSYPSVSKTELNSLIGNSPISNSSYESRFLIYVYARQTAKWQNMIFKDSADSEKQISKGPSINSMPPTYICQSSSDPDVPFINSIMLKAKIPNAKLIPVGSKDHDFDRIVTQSTLNLYETIIDWLNTITD